jgi:hypothetical protein
MPLPIQLHPTRRRFLAATSGLALAPGLFGQADRRIAAAGPASKYVPRVKAAFVRRKGDYGMLWPGAIWDGEGALRKYRQ